MQGPVTRSRLSGVHFPRVGARTRATATPPSVLSCPRCQVALTDPEGLGLCPRCGYCRSLVEAATVPTEDRPTAVEVAAPTFVASWRAARLLPESALAVLLATICLLPICYYADRGLPPNSTVRVTWCVLQILTGLSVIFAAQVWAFMLFRRHDEPASLLDLVFPAQLWSRTILALPHTGGPVTLAVSGGLTILLAIFWIGGWVWWLHGDTTPDRPTAPTTVAGRDWRDEYKRLKDAAALVATNERDATATPSPSPAAGVSDARPTAQCVIIGYSTGPDGQLSSLALATLRDGKLTYAGMVKNGVNKNETPTLLKKLTALSSKAAPLGNVEVKANWVRPEVFCEVQHSDADAQGLLVNPFFKAVIED